MSQKKEKGEDFDLAVDVTRAYFINRFGLMSGTYG
jgi:hypothetical protein